MDTPDALVLSVLCDFKGKDELDILLYITKRLEELTRDEHTLGKYMLILETLSTNRDLQRKLKEAETMLREIKYEQLPSYEIGLEKGIERGIERGIKQGTLQATYNNAVLMVKEFGLDVAEVAKKLNISISELKKYLEKDK